MKKLISLIIALLILAFAIGVSYQVGFNQGKYQERDRWSPIFDRMMKNDKTTNIEDGLNTCAYQLKDCWDFVNQREIK